jgi:hypothetical protein
MVRSIGKSLGCENVQAIVGQKQEIGERIEAR